MALTEKQKAELNSAIFEYLKDSGYNETLDIFQKESQSVMPESSVKMLERKWVSVVRLTKKVSELEAKVAEYEQELKEAKPFSFQDPNSKHKLYDDVLPNSQLFVYKCHQKGINRVLFHPTYSWLVSCGDNAQIAICDHENGKFEKWIRGHTNTVHDLSFNNNGTLLASASADMSIKIWDFEDEFRCIKTLNGHDHVVTGVTFCRHNDDILVSCSRDGTVKFWDLTTGYTTNTISDTHDGEWVKKIIISFDGSMFATCSVDQCVKVFDFKSGECIQTLRGHTHVVECIAFSHPTAEEVISGKTREEMKKSDLFEDYETAPLYIASGSRDKTIIIWNIKTGEIVMTLRGHENWVRSIVFHPCGRYLISCGDDKSVRFWDLVHQRQKSIIDEAHESFVSTIDWNPNSNLLATGSSSKTVKIWNYDSTKS